MTITSGTRLGPYEIVAPLGAGGMGEVWRGRDTRLDRSVAIKILPAEFAENAQFKVRFEREAKTISQLNHPNICTLYDVGVASVAAGFSPPTGDGGLKAAATQEVSYLVMELLEGESLEDRLKKGPLPLEQVLRYGVQIAEALDKAHKAGVVHRDLKPGNVMITKTGAKLLDFGLAKPAEGGVLNALTFRVLAPIRRVIPPLGGSVDLSPLIVIVLAQLALILPVACLEQSLARLFQ